MYLLPSKTCKATILLQKFSHSQKNKIYYSKAQYVYNKINLLALKLADNMHIRRGGYPALKADPRSATLTATRPTTNG